MVLCLHRHGANEHALEGVPAIGVGVHPVPVPCRGDGHDHARPRCHAVGVEYHSRHITLLDLACPVDGHVEGQGPAVVRQDTHIDPIRVRGLVHGLEAECAHTNIREQENARCISRRRVAPAVAQGGEQDARVRRRVAALVEDRAGHAAPGLHIQVDVHDLAVEVNGRRDTGNLVGLPVDHLDHERPGRVVVLDHVIELVGPVAVHRLLGEERVPPCPENAVVQPDVLEEPDRRVRHRLSLGRAHRAADDGSRALGRDPDRHRHVTGHAVSCRITDAGDRDRPPVEVPVFSRRSEEGPDAVAQEQEDHPAALLEIGLPDDVLLDGVIGDILGRFFRHLLREHHGNGPAVLVSSDAEPGHELRGCHDCRRRIRNDERTGLRNRGVNGAVVVIVDIQNIRAVRVRQERDPGPAARRKRDTAELDLLQVARLDRQDNTDVERRIRLGLDLDKITRRLYFCYE